MENVFIVNPNAGQGKIEKLVNTLDYNGSKLYITKAVGDAERYVREYCKKNPSVRFIACGGDGTLNEILNGSFGYENVEIGVIPTGTGNDFCRNFEGNFENIDSQLKGTTVKCDAIRYTTNGVSRYCANMFNIGFDCNVADMTSAMKKKPLISGSFAYFLSIIAMLIKKKGADLKIEIDGKTVHNGPLLLTSVANGKCCGGGIASNPYADVSDGKINVNIIKNVSRIKFISLLPRYMKGTHLAIKNIETIIKTADCKKIVITPNKSTYKLCCDGEITTAEQTVFEIIPNAFNFVIPNE